MQCSVLCPVIICTAAGDDNINKTGVPFPMPPVHTAATGHQELYTELFSVEKISPFRDSGSGPTLFEDSKDRLVRN